MPHVASTIEHALFWLPEEESSESEAKYDGGYRHGIYCLGLYLPIQKVKSRAHYRAGMAEAGRSGGQVDHEDRLDWNEILRPGVNLVDVSHH